jgi:enoyl-CoA hydratase/carnithine racemase
MSTGTSSGVVVRRDVEHVAEVVLDRPEALNAVSTALGRQLTSVLRELAADAGVWAVVLSSSNDRAFCVGADLKERADFDDDQLLAQRPVIRAMFASVRDLPMPVVAAVTGFALGGGFELALSCDVIVADATAVFGLPEVTVGLVPGGGGTQLLARRVGTGVAADLVLSGRKVGAPEASRIGIVDRLVEGRDDERTDGERRDGERTARQTALDVAVAIAANSPVAVRAAKRALHDGLGRPLVAGLEIEDTAWHAAAVSADRREGITAFAEKRPPQWSGT